MIHHLSYWTIDSLNKLMNNNITNYEIEFVQRYGFSNYLNWIYKLGGKMDCDMNDDIKYEVWLHAKKRKKYRCSIIKFYFYKYMLIYNINRKT